MCILAAKCHEDRAAHRLVKTLSPELGSGLVFPDYCIFKSLNSHPVNRKTPTNVEKKSDQAEFVDGEYKRPQYLHIGTSLLLKVT